MPQVLTKNGFKKYDGLLVKYDKKEKIKLHLSNNKKLIGTLDHKVLNNKNQYIECKDLVIGDVLYPNLIINNIEKLISNDPVYDLVNVHEQHSYYTNSVISHNCVILDEYAHVGNNLAEEFFTSVYPVISSGENSKIVVISTSKGLNHYYKLFTDALAKRNDYFPIDIHWTRIPGRDEKFKEEFIRNTSLNQWMQEIESLDKTTCISIEKGGIIHNITIGELYDELQQK